MAKLQPSFAENSVGKSAFWGSSLLVLLESQSKPAKDEEAKEENDFVSHKLPAAVPCQAVVLQHILSKQLDLQKYAKVADSAYSVGTAEAKP